MLLLLDMPYVIINVRDFQLLLVYISVLKSLEYKIDSKLILIKLNLDFKSILSHRS